MSTASKKIERNSEQRRLIMDYLHKSKNHPTAKDIYQKLQKKLPEIGLATIYRNLDFLEKNKRIIKLKSKDKEARYDGFTDSHCHLICRECGKIIDLMDFEGIIIKSKSLRKTKFKIDSDCVELFGLCERCK